MKTVTIEVECRDEYEADAMQAALERVQQWFMAHKDAVGAPSEHGATARLTFTLNAMPESAYDCTVLEPMKALGLRVYDLGCTEEFTIPDLLR